MYRHQAPLVVLVPSSTPMDVEANGRRLVWPQRQQLAVSTVNSTSSASRTQSPIHVQKLRQRRLTRMLLFISFAWLALTAPFTLHSFLPAPSYSSPSSSSVETNFTSMSSVSINSTFDQLVYFIDSENVTLKIVYEKHYDTLQSMTTVAAFDPKQSRTTTARLFLIEEQHHTWSAASTPTTPSPLPSASINPSRYFLVKIICFLLMYLNHAINFYLYCLTGKRFRKELAAMLNCGQGPKLLICGTKETVADAVGDVAIEMNVRNRRRDDAVNNHNHHAPAGSRTPLYPPHSSTSSRARSGRAARKSELIDERYS